MSDPWWFRSTSRKLPLDRIDATFRAGLLIAVDHKTRWIRRVALLMIGGWLVLTVAIVAHDATLHASGPDAWWHALLPFSTLPFFFAIGVNARVTTATERLVREHDGRDLRTEIATLLASH